MSLVGQKIKDFQTQAYHQGKFIAVSQLDFIGKWSLLFFYPADFSYVCPTELASLQAQVETLTKRNVQVFACSTDSHFTHKAWHEESKEVAQVTFPLLGDPAHQVTKAFDVLDETSGFAQRGTFLIDPEGVIQYLEISAENMGRDAQTLLPKIEMAQYLYRHPEEACPADWQKTKQPIKPKLDLTGKL